MLRPLKFKTKDGNILVGTDTHFHHDREFIYKVRGYSSMKEHDEAIIRIWNERVKPKDIVIFLGDFVLNASYEVIVRYLKQLNGHIFATWGNHHSGMRQLYTSCVNEFLTNNVSRNVDLHVFPPVEVYPVTWKHPDTHEDKFTFCGHYIYGTVDKQEFVASHFALRTWDKQGHGVWNLCGHSHANDIQSNPDWKVGKRLDVSIEKFGGPVEWSEIAKIMEQKSIESTDHHNESTTSSSF